MWVTRYMGVWLNHISVQLKFPQIHINIQLSNTTLSRTTAIFKSLTNLPQWFQRSNYLQLCIYMIYKSIICTSLRFPSVVIMKTKKSKIPYIIAFWKCYHCSCTSTRQYYFILENDSLVFNIAFKMLLCM